MSLSLIVQELAIVVAVKTDNPSLLSEDFLKYSGIIPSDWQLDSPPVSNQRVTQVVFKNGFSIAAQPDRVMFLEAIGQKPIEDVVAAQVASRYLSVMKLAEYQALGINLRSYLEDTTKPDNMQNYLTRELLKPGSWQQHGESLVGSTINLNYQLSGRKLNLSINEAMLQLPNRSPLPVVLFSGNYDYALADLAAPERLTQLTQTIDNWQKDLADYTQLIQSGFLESTASWQQAQPTLV